MIPNLKSVVINMTFSIVITMARRLVRLSPKETKNQEKREEFFFFSFFPRKFKQRDGKIYLVKEVSR